MTGIKHIKIYNKKVSYEFDLERNVSVISGNSATGKTTLFNLVRDYEKNKNNGVSLVSDVECLTLNNSDWEYKVEKYDSVVFFIDENNKFYKTKEFANSIKKADCYFVIITRDSMPEISYSVDAMYEIVGKKKHKLVKKYDLKKINYWLPSIVKVFNKFDSFIVEDSESGFRLFESIANKLNKKCKSSNGNSNLYKYVDSKKHISHEQYYTDLLKSITKNDKVFKYSKKKLNKNYVKDENIKKFIKFIFKNYAS